MNSIPIKAAISSGAWYQCQSVSWNGQLDFRLRVLSFERRTVAEIDRRLVGKVVIEGVLWLLSVEVVNVSKEPIDAKLIGPIIRLIDEGGFAYPNLRAPDLDWGQASGLRRFSIWANPLLPKITARGSIAFVLPDEDNSYSFAIHKGSAIEA